MTPAERLRAALLECLHPVGTSIAFEPVCLQCLTAAMEAHADDAMLIMRKRAADKVRETLAMRERGGRKSTDEHLLNLVHAIEDLSLSEDT